MASSAGGQPPTGVDFPSNPTPQPANNNPVVNPPLVFSKILKPTSLNTLMHVNPTTNNPPAISIKPVTFLHGQPLVKFTEEEVHCMNIFEGLQYPVVGKFLYGWPELQELRIIIPLQCGVKGECNVGFLKDMHVLIRLTLFEDFINFTSKEAYYLKAKDGYEYQIRPLIYDSKFNVNEETPMAMAWISFPNLLPTIFFKRMLVLIGF